MGGYWGRTSGAIDVHDPLMVRVLVAGCADARICLVCLDLVALDSAAVADVRTRIHAATGIPGEAVMVCCTHTHAGPLTVRFRGMGDVDEAYFERVVQTAVDTVEGALSHLRPATALYCRVPVQLGINRRQQRSQSVVIGENPEGPVARYAHVVYLQGAGGRSCALFSHACHPVVMGNANHSISAEFAGAAVRHVEDATNGFGLFVNGACGDINPRTTGGTFDDVDELGAELGRAVVGGLSSAEPIGSTEVAAGSERVNLPLIDPPSRAQMMAEKLVVKTRARIEKMVGGNYWSQLVSSARLEWAEEMYELARSGARGLAQPFEIQVMRIGGLALLGLEGEMFVRYQLELEEASPRPMTVLCGYANGCIGYVPTADEYERGGYEVGTPYDFSLDAGIEAYKVYPSVQMIGPESEDIIRGGALDLLGKV